MFVEDIPSPSIVTLREVYFFVYLKSQATSSPTFVTEGGVDARDIFIHKYKNSFIHCTERNY